MKNLIMWIIALALILGAYFYFGNNTTLKNINQTINNNINNGKKEIGEKIIKETNDGEAGEKMIENLSNSKTFKNEFEKQKANMPKYLSLTKKYKTCIEGVSDKSGAIKCMKSIDKEGKELGLKNNGPNSKITEWSEEKKKNVLEELSGAISEMEKMSKCFKTSTDMMGAVKCAEKMN